MRVMLRRWGQRAVSNQWLMLSGGKFVVYEPGKG